MPGRSKENQKLFDELGEVEYRALLKYNRSLSQKKYKEKNKEKLKIQDKIYRDTHKEEKKEYNETHKEEIKEYQKGYRDTHKEEIQEYRDTHKEERKEYDQTPAGIKRKTLTNWKTNGITFGDMTNSEYYDNIYLPATICQSCEKVFNKINKNDWKCADHKHDRKDPCNIRGVICNQCNIHDQWKTRLTEDSIYNQYLYRLADIHL